MKFWGIVWWWQLILTSLPGREVCGIQLNIGFLGFLCMKVVMVEAVDEDGC